MKYGTTIRFNRTYDEGLGWVEGSTWTVGHGDDQIAPGHARSLLRDTADGEPFAEVVDRPGDEGGEEGQS